jgi:hypothetical protein
VSRVRAMNLNRRARHNGSMTAPVAKRDATQTAAHRIAAMLMGIGTVHFLAPGPFDTIVPAELP